MSDGFCTHGRPRAMFCEACLVEFHAGGPPAVAASPLADAMLPVPAPTRRESDETYTVRSLRARIASLEATIAEERIARAREREELLAGLQRAELRAADADAAARALHRAIATQTEAPDDAPETVHTALGQVVLKARKYEDIAPTHTRLVKAALDWWLSRQKGLENMRRPNSTAHVQTTQAFYAVLADLAEEEHKRNPDQLAYLVARDARWRARQEGIQAKIKGAKKALAKKKRTKSP